MKYECQTCHHDAIHHFALGTKCSVEGCDCMRSQSEVVSGAIAARMEDLEVAKQELIAVLEDGCEYHHKPLINGWAHQITEPGGHKKTIRCRLSERARTIIAKYK